MEKEEGKKLPQHFRKSWLPSKLCFCFITPLINRVMRNGQKMTGEDIEDMTVEDNETEKQYQRFMIYLDEYLSQTDGQKPQYSKLIMKSMFKTFRLSYLISFCGYMLSDSSTILISFMLSKFLEYLADEEASVRSGIGMLIVFLVLLVIQNVFRVGSWFYTGVIGYRIRKVVNIALYRKIGKMSLKSVYQSNPSKLITLISSDLFVIEKIMPILPCIITSPLINLLAYGLIWHIIGYEYALITFGMLIVMIISTLMNQKQILKQRVTSSVLNDSLIHLASDLVIGAKTLKCYGWEEKYLEKIAEVRGQQEKSLKIFNFLQLLGVIVFQNFGMPCAVICFVTMWARDQPIDSANALAAFTIMQMLFYVINQNFFQSFVTFVVLNSIFNRMGEVLHMDELQFMIEDDKKKEEGQEAITSSPIVTVSNASFSWEFEDNEQLLVRQESSPYQLDTGRSPIVEGEEIKASCVLKEINFELQQGLIMVVGRIGCGKSSLLFSILKETNLKEGSIHTSGKIAYVEQEPFILQGTVLENILFGDSFDQERYDYAVKHSQLQSDIDGFPHGVNSFVGEKGVNFSGGQKARVSLARALYSNADIFLLDDPLSAVDPQVADKIFHDCIVEQLSQKIVILVTHQLQFLKYCERILLLEKGRQKCFDTYEKIIEQGYDIESIVKSYQNSQAQQNQQEELDHVNDVGSEDFSQDEINERSKIIAEILETQSIILDPELNGPEIQNRNKGEEADAAYQKEVGLSGRVSFADYYGFFSQPCGWFTLVIYLFIFVIAALAQLVPSYIFTQWMGEDDEGKTKRAYPFGFGISTVIFFILAFVRGQTSNVLVVSSATILYRKIAIRLMRAKVQFFDENPSGKILTRFSKEITILDAVISFYLTAAGVGCFRAISVFVTVCIVNPYLCIALAIALIIFAYYIRTANIVMNESQRLDSLYRGPLHQNLITMVSGLSTFRAYGKINHYTDQFQNYLELATNATFSQFAVARWVGMRIDICNFVFVISTCVFIFAMKDNLDYALSAYSLQIMFDVTAFFAIFLRLLIEMDNMMLSAKRVLEYTKLEIEDDLRKEFDESKLGQNWPKSGDIEFRNVTMRYKQNLEPALKQINIKINSGEKIGVIGRTGAGKSSILGALFRMYEIEEDGLVLIDGVDTKLLGLHKLRKNMGIIPQTPFIMNGTIRENLDPSQEFSDKQIESALEQVKLLEYINSLPQGLMTEIKDSNAVFSVGQKQLICLARAILIKPKILVLDEATANVDLETDFLIQKNLSDQFEGCSKVIIAHRLATVIDADKILVMSNGEAVEFDSPFNLLAKSLDDSTITRKGHFAKMIKILGSEPAQNLFNIAKRKAMQK